MKNLVFLISLFFLISFQEPGSKLEGTWKMVEVKSISNGDISYAMPGNIKADQTKVWSGDRFLFFGSFNMADQSQTNYGSGSFTLSGRNYIENIDIHIGENYRGASVKLLVDIVGDTLIQIYPLKDDWTFDTENYTVEKYIRVE